MPINSSGTGPSFALHGFAHVGFRHERTGVVPAELAYRLTLHRSLRNGDFGRFGNLWRAFSPLRLCMPVTDTREFRSMYVNISHTARAASSCSLRNLQ
jgi:hypothetical protein